MKILEINMFDKVVGGVERYISTLGHETVRMGHELSHVYIARQDGPGELISGINTHYIPQLSMYGCGEFIRGRFSRTVQDGLDMLREIIRSERPDIIHVHNVYYPVFIGMLQEFCPVVRTIHDYRFLCPNLMKIQARKGEICNANVGLECFRSGCLSYKKPMDYRHLMFILLEREVSMGYDRHIVKSRYMRDVLVSNGFNRDRISVLPLCTEIVESKDLLPKNRILFAGRIAPEKGLDILCEALKSLPMYFKATFAGGGIIENDIKRLVDRLGLRDKVDFVGWLSPAELSKAYLESTVVVVPSMWHEPFGLVGLEAMAHGRPVIAFNVGGIPDWLEHGETGFLAKQGDIEGLASRIRLILGDHGLAVKLGQNGKRIIKEKFNSKQNTRNLLSIYEQVLSKGHGEIINQPAAELPVKHIESLPVLNQRLAMKTCEMKKPAVYNYPNAMTLAITTRCNMTPPCVMCTRNINPPEWENECEDKILDRAKRIFPYLDILYLHCNGEPLYSNNFKEILKIVKPPTKIRFNSNGLLLDKRMAHLIIDSRVVDVINFSIDASSPETYKKIRGGDFHRVIKNIVRLAKVVRKKKADYFTIVVNMCLMKENIREVPAFIELAKRIGAKGVDIFHLNEGMNWRCERKSFVFDYLEQSVIDPEYHDRMIEEAYHKAQKYGIPINFVGSPFMQKKNTNIGHKMSEIDKRDSCMAPWSEVVVDRDGKVRICCYHNHDDSIGDLSLEDFWSIWNGDKVQKMRKEMSMQRLASDCLNTKNLCIFRGRK